MNESFEDFGKYGKELAESGLTSLASLSKGAQAIAAEAGKYASRSLEESGAAVEKLLSAKSLEEAFDVQSRYLKSAYEGFVAETTAIGNLYADLARDAYKPFESVIGRAG